MSADVAKGPDRDRAQARSTLSRAADRLRTDADSWREAHTFADGRWDEHSIATGVPDEYAAMHAIARELDELAGRYFPVERSELLRGNESSGARGNSTKKVTVALKVDSEFVKLLNLNVNLKAGGMADLSGRDVAGVLAGVFLLEARGATPEQVHAAIPQNWRAHIEAVGDLRVVEEVPHTANPRIGRGGGG